MTNLVKKKKTLEAEIARLDAALEAADLASDKLEVERDKVQEALDVLDPKPQPQPQPYANIWVDEYTSFKDIKPGSIYYGGFKTGRSPWFDYTGIGNHFDRLYGLSPLFTAGYGYAKAAPKYSFKAGDRVVYNDVIYGSGSGPMGANGSVGVVETDVSSDARDTNVQVCWESNPTGNRLYGTVGGHVAGCHIGNLTKAPAKYSFKVGDRVEYNSVYNPSYSANGERGTVTGGYVGDNAFGTADVKWDGAGNGCTCADAGNLKLVPKTAVREFRIGDKVKLRGEPCSCIAKITYVSLDGTRADVTWSNPFNLGPLPHDRTVFTSKLVLA